VATDLKAAEGCERKGEPSVFRILGWMHVTGSAIHLQAATANSFHDILVLQNTLCYIIAVYEETRQEMYFDFILRSVRANIGGVACSLFQEPKKVALLCCCGKTHHL